MSTDFDYIVVGGGSAGCVVAGELARDPNLRVLLLECGDPAEANPETLRADGYKDAFRNDRLIWERFSTPQPACGGRRLFLGTGRGMGGSGSVNSMVYTRGDARDYDAWPSGWRWTDNIPAFEAVESRLGLHRREPTRWTEAAMAAARLAGFRSSPDLNDGDLSSAMGYEWMNYNENMRRSSYVAFIRPERSAADNLVIKTGALARRVLLEGRQAVGVLYDCGGKTHSARTTGEIILTAGALETPKLLLLSGIGTAENLRAHGIPMAVENQEVGLNLHDHPNVTLFFRGHDPVDSHYPQLYGFHRVGDGPRLASAQSDTCYVMYPARSSLHEAMVRMLPTVLLPERLYNLGWVRGATRSMIDMAFGTASLRRQVARVYGIVVILGKPSSRGSLSLRSADPKETARVDPCYFTAPDDLRTMVAGVAKARLLAAGDPLARWGNRELWPGPRTVNDGKVTNWIRQNAMTTFHFAGTCRMGEDPRAVVDTRLRVRGVRGLRVADASVIPWTPVAAMNAPSMMVGWRAAAMLQEERLARGSDRGDPVA